MLGAPRKLPPTIERQNPLTGKYDDFYANAKVYDQKFGLVLTSDNLRNPAKMSLSYGPDNFYPWRPFAAPDRAQKKDKAKQQWLASQFAIHIDVQHFKPNEIRIKVTGRQCNVKASHKDREDDHGFVARKFEREFALPKDIDVETVKSIISSDGVLTFKAARNSAGQSSTTRAPETYTTTTSLNFSQQPEEPKTEEPTTEEPKTEAPTEGIQNTAIIFSNQQLELLEENGTEIPIEFVKEDETGHDKEDE